MSTARGNRSVQDAIVLDWWGSRVLNLLAVFEDRRGQQGGDPGLCAKVCEGVDSGENRGWPWPSIGKGKREGRLSTNVLEEGKTVSGVVTACQKRLSLQSSERGEYFHTNPPARVGDLIFNTNPQ